MNERPEEKATVGMLKEMIGDRNIPILQALVDGKEDKAELKILDLSSAVAYAIWDMNDIGNILENEGYKNTTENIHTVLVDSHDILKNLFKDVEQDYMLLTEAIEEAIESVSEKLERK